MPSIVEIKAGDSPVVASAIHDGHAVRDEVRNLLAIDEAVRLREEDPYTAFFTSIAPSCIIGLRSRFEVDLNRPRDKAVYRMPDDCWGLQLWKAAPPDELVTRSLKEYDESYDAVRALLIQVADRHGHFVVFDLHSFNHRRGGPAAPPASPEENPEVNIGTGSMDRSRWGRLVDRFMEDLRSFDYRGRHLDVRENVKFKGGHFSQWVHATFPDRGAALAIELKKFFMDEWTGRAEQEELHLLRRALDSTVAGVLEELSTL